MEGILKELPENRRKTREKVSQGPGNKKCFKKQVKRWSNAAERSGKMITE